MVYMHGPQLVELVELVELVKLVKLAAWRRVCRPVLVQWRPGWPFVVCHVLPDDYTHSTADQ
jgi:hypothetical protein